MVDAMRGDVSPRISRSLFAVALLAVLSAGCGDQLRPVSGTVMVDGKPAMAGVRVMFAPVGKSRVAEGVVGADGSFAMKTFSKPGVMAGDYRVILTNSTDSIPRPDAPAPTEHVEGVSGGVMPASWDEYNRLVQKFFENPPKGPGWIPKSYSEVGKTPLKWSVPKDGAKATFEVTSSPGAKP